MPNGAFKPRPPGSLKEAYSRLVDACGGPAEAAQLDHMPVSRSLLFKYTDPDCEHHMRADVVKVLEAHCGDPIVTTYLAHSAGFVLSSIAPEGSAALQGLLARVSKEHGDLMVCGLDALADGEVTIDEARRILREADDALAAVSKIRDAASQIVRTGDL